MKNIFNSFYAKLAALFLGLIVALGVTITLLSVRAGMQLADEAEQKLNRQLAANLAQEFQPFLLDTIDEERIHEKINYMMLVNPRIEIYLLEGDGTIKASFVGPDKHLEQTQVALEPIQRYLDGAEVPILGSDPLSAERTKPFSAAPIVIMGNPDCYLYIILSSAQYDSAAGMVQDSYIMQATLKGLGLTLLCTVFVGLLLFALLTRRLRGMNEVVASFSRGQFDRRVADTSSDEIGQLATTFNQMADTIVANMDALRRTDRLRRELIANVSHDLRSPLSSVQGYLETILMKHAVLDPEERRQYVEVALKNTRLLNTLVSELFELSKLDAEQVEPAFEVFAVAELAQDLVLQFTPHAHAAHVRLEVDIPAELPPVYADIALVERALANLIDNALHYTPSGGEVRIALHAAVDRVHISVIDTGYGIPPDDLPHIFERFYRVEKSRGRDTGGSGLGLAIARKILELHGSTLSVHSVVDQGTTFTFSLPVGRAHATRSRLQPA